MKQELKGENNYLYDFPTMEELREYYKTWEQRKDIKNGIYKTKIRI